MRKHQIASALSLLAFGAFISFEARKFVIGRIVKPGPGFFPFWLGLALVALSLVLVVRYGRGKNDPPSPPGGMREDLDRRRIPLTLIALLLYIFFLEEVGYLLATSALLVFLFRVIEAPRWWILIAASVGASVSTYVLFDWWLQVRLPVGLWGI